MTVALLYRTVPHNGGVVFAREEAAQYVARIHLALRTATTWAEFRAMMPRKAYSDLVRYYDEEGKARPRGTDPFSPESVPGWNEGDYPPWLQQMMARWIPADILEKYAKLEQTFLNGSYWHIPAEDAQKVAKALRGRGFIVRAAHRLEFY